MTFERRFLVNLFGKTETTLRCTAAVGAIVAAGLLSGCMSSPTYGTDKTANEQLVGDLSGILSLKPDKKAQIDYKPRPELVKPAPGEAEQLPAPQDSVTSGDNPAWPESPEKKRARLLAETSAKRDQPGFTPLVEDDAVVTMVVPEPTSNASNRFKDSGLSPTGAEPLSAKRAEFKRKLAETRQGSSTSRKYLSEPPLEYRQPAATAASGELGEDEAKKERRLKAAARKKGGGLPKWADIWPF